MLDSDLKKIPIGHPDASPPEASHLAVDSALKEAELLGSNLTAEQIKRRAEANEANRNEKFRNHFEKIAILSLWGFFVLFTGLISAWFWHYLAPVAWHWLTAEQLTKVQTLATGGIVATIAAGHLKKRLG
ncbi:MULTISPECIES: hypothetical protein [unclassified Sinorhizobium]|uniref:hypothetical protein n=1 Tax=unclassified Sinorhizobium TaxID=2613772 RepID=UPI0024C33FA2|nr:MULTISPECIES: hypothetical protein [unclassified Sinorhizobium]MDK1377079.1 hypothetical protein [Sinorhizobium sp. 6-70]MDK1479626.1 hypothetical protein [Sinorhizobium sp. 6-117]